MTAPDARTLLAALVEAYDRQTGNPKASLALRAVMVNARTYLASPPPEPETYTTDGRPYNGPPLASPPPDGLRHSWDATCDTPPDDDPYCHCARTFDATAPSPAIDDDVGYEWAPVGWEGKHEKWGWRKREAPPAPAPASSSQLTAARRYGSVSMPDGSVLGPILASAAPLAPLDVERLADAIDACWAHLLAPDGGKRPGLVASATAIAAAYSAQGEKPTPLITYTDPVGGPDPEGDEA